MAADATAASGTLPGHWSRVRGCTYSETCSCCVESTDSMEAALRRQHAAAGVIGEAPRRMVCCIAGDIKGIEQLAGHAGASATYNCMFCEARLHQTYMAGVPHLRVLPEPWASTDKRAPEIINPPARGGTAATSAQATAYMEAAAAPNAKDLSSGDERFKSCCLLPLFRSNDLEEHVSRTPLHVTLGLGTNYLKAVEARCAARDSDWALNTSDQALGDEFVEAFADLHTAKEAVAECECEVRSTEAGIAIILQKDPNAARKGRTDAGRADGRDVWVLEYRRYQEEKKVLEGSLKKLTAAVTAAAKVETGVRERILKLTPEGTGPFGTRFKALLVALKISMKKYFGGTYIGPDLHKIFGVTAHIRMLCDVLKAGSFACPDGVTREFGSDEEADELYSCLRPFGELHQLFNRKEPLCEHEIERFQPLVEEHAIAFAKVFPTTVPTLKMHILSMHMKELLDRHGSIGMDTEQGIECYHPEVTYVFNQFRSLDRQPEAQMVAVAKHCWARGSGARVSERGGELRAAKTARAEKQRMVVKLEKST